MKNKRWTKASFARKAREIQKARDNIYWNKIAAREPQARSPIRSANTMRPTIFMQR